jgi:hypothetical protein
MKPGMWREFVFVILWMGILIGLSQGKKGAPILRRFRFKPYSGETNPLLG